mmetsp:Transcript_118825/g.341132  ORF Transcript_118825/g.341132 Transcript_118825/m.341132 type:complete len:440 (+) Transcript_118825:388-1707(+)
MLQEHAAEDPQIVLRVVHLWAAEEAVEQGQAELEPAAATKQLRQAVPEGLRSNLLAALGGVLRRVAAFPDDDMLANRAVGLRRDLLLDAIADFAGGDSCAVHGSEGVRERERRQGQAAVGISLARLRPRLIVSMISSNADFWRQAAEDSGGQAHGRAQRDHGVGLDLQQAQLCVAILSARVFEELVGRQSEFAVAKLDAQRQQVRVLPHRAVADDEAAIVGRNTAHLLKGLGGDDRSHEALEDLWGHQHEIGPCVDEEADPRRRFLVDGHAAGNDPEGAGLPGPDGLGGRPHQRAGLAGGIGLGADGHVRAVPACGHEGEDRLLPNIQQVLVHGLSPRRQVLPTDAEDAVPLQVWGQRCLLDDDERLVLQRQRVDLDAVSDRVTEDLAAAVADLHPHGPHAARRLAQVGLEGARLVRPEVALVLARLATFGRHPEVRAA